MRHPATAAVTVMTLAADEKEDLQDVMTEKLYELPKSSPDLYSYLDSGYPSSSPDSQSRKRRTTRGAFSSSQAVLTLPGVVLWCRDGVCYPYYKKPNRNGKPVPQIPDPRYCSFTDGVIEDKTMPTIITMKSPDTLHSQSSRPSSMNNVVNEDSLVATNTSNANNYGDFNVHKHTISVKNIPSSPCFDNICNSAVKSERNYRISTISSKVPHPISTYPDRVTLTVNSAPSTSISEKEQEQELASRSSCLDRGLSQRPLDLHQLTNNNGQFKHNKNEKNITRCSLGPVSGSTYANNMSQHYPAAKLKVFALDSDLDDSFKLKSTISSDNNISSKTNTAHALPDSISYPDIKLNPFCPSCRGIVPLNHTEPTLLAPSKIEPGFWNSNNCHTNLHREASFHSYGGFTLNGQSGHIPTKKYKMRRFCSSNKVAFVVSTFSLIVTIGLIITLLLMKKKGMMEAMR